MEDEEALEARAVVREAADFVGDRVDELLADGVVATGICRAARPSTSTSGAQRGQRGRLTVVRRVLLAGDHRLGVEERAVGAALDIVDGARLEVDV